MKNRLKTELFTDYMRVNNLSKSAFAKKCRISYSTLIKILNNQDNFGVIALFKVGRVIKVNLCDMFN